MLKRDFVVEEWIEVGNDGECIWMEDGRFDTEAEAEKHLRQVERESRDLRDDRCFRIQKRFYMEKSL